MTHVIKETGSYFEVDAEGFLVNPTSFEKVQVAWRPVVAEIVSAYQSIFSEKLFSVYVRGSVAKGEAVPYFSDIDTFAYITDNVLPKEKEKIKKFKKQLEDAHPFVQKIEMEIDRLDAIEDDQFWIAQALLVWGEKTEVKKFKIGKEIIFHLSFLEQVEHKVQQRLEKNKNALAREGTCAWLCKQVLRSGIELCYERSHKYSRDLFRCWETFSQVYPTKSKEMEEVLFLALNPSGKVDVIQQVANQWIPWLLKERDRLGYSLIARG